MKKLIRH